MHTRPRTRLIAPLAIAFMSLILISAGCAMFGPSPQEIADQTAIAGIQASLDALNGQRTATQVAGVTMVAQATRKAETAGTARAEVSATTAAQKTATAWSAVSNADVIHDWGLVIYEPFEKNSYGWPDGETWESDWGTNKFKVVDGELEWNVVSRQSVLQWMYPLKGGSLGDFYVSVRVRMDRDEPDAGYGIVFRANTSTYAYHSFIVSESGTYTIYTVNEASVGTVLKSGRTNMLTKGGNTLAVKGVGTQFKFYVNGEAIAELSDEHLEKGKVGLLIELNHRAIDINYYFDDFIVLTP